MSNPRKFPVILASETTSDTASGRCTYDATPTLAPSGMTLDKWRAHNSAQHCKSANECMLANNSRNLRPSEIAQECLSYADLGTDPQDTTPLNGGQLDSANALARNVVATRAADGKGVHMEGMRKSVDANTVTESTDATKQVYYPEVEKLSDYNGTDQKVVKLREELREAAQQKLDTCSVLKQQGFKVLVDNNNDPVAKGCMGLRADQCRAAGTFCELTNATTCSKYMPDGSDEPVSCESGDCHNCVEYKNGDKVVLSLKNPRTGVKKCHAQNPVDEHMALKTTQNGMVTGSNPSNDTCNTTYQTIQIDPQLVRVEKKNANGTFDYHSVANVSANSVCDFSGVSMHQEAAVACKVGNVDKENVSKTLGDKMKVAEFFGVPKEDIRAVKQRVTDIQNQPANLSCKDMTTPMDCRGHGKATFASPRVKGTFSLGDKCITTTDGNGNFQCKPQNFAEEKQQLATAIDTFVKNNNKANDRAIATAMKKKFKSFGYSL